MATFGQGSTPWSPTARAREWERRGVFQPPDGHPMQPQEMGADGSEPDRRSGASREHGDDFVRWAMHRRYQ